MAVNEPKHGDVVDAASSLQSSEAFAVWTEELLALEKEAEEEETTELLMTCSHTELQARGLAVLKLVVGEQTTALYGRVCLTLARPGGAPLPTHRITNGDIVGLFDQATRPLSKAVPLATAVVQRARPLGIAVVFDGDVPVEVLDGRQLHIAAVSSDVTLKRYKEALDQLKSGRVSGPATQLVDVCFGDRFAPRFREAKTEDCSRPDAVDCEFRSEQARRLNEPQQAAVVRALRAADVACIHGPPGTGKTTTLVAYILEAAYRKERLLVTAPSNVAVDNLLERVLDCGFKSVVRLGHPARVQSELHGYTMDNVVYNSEQASLCRDIKKEIDDNFKRSSGKSSSAKQERKSASEVSALRKELRQRERRAVMEVLKHTQVVFATCAGAATLHREIRRGGGDASAASNLEFDVVVIDEAAQALEIACWIPLLLGRKAVLAGDHQQLAACVKSNAAQRRGLDRTLFARTIEKYGDDVATLLSIQYRMNSAIMGWSSQSFYAGRLEAAESVASRTLPLVEVPDANLMGETLELMKSPLLFVDTGGLAQYREEGADEAAKSKSGSSGNADVHQSRGNPGEASFLVHYAKMLVRCGVAPKDMTVISPYNRQVERLKAEFAEDGDCQKLGLDQPRVNTVDSFQGQEADAVLISLVRSNERGVVGFLSDYRRLNVAVTRARKHVMLVGDAATIGTDSTLASLYDYSCEHGCVAFVQQLLDEDGNVPPDPAAAAAAAEQIREAKVAQQVQKNKERQQSKAQEEEQHRARFRKILSPLLETDNKGWLEFPKSLSPFERALAHDIATELGLNHESQGEGNQRRLLVWAPRVEKPERSASSNKGTKNGSTVKPGDETSQAKEAEEPDGETVLEAFERRAKALLASLSPAQAVAEWKAPSDEEFSVLQRLATDNDLEISMVGSGKKRKCRVELRSDTVASGAVAAETSTQGYPADSSSAAASSSAAHPATVANSPPAASANNTLAELHAERQRRQEANARKQAVAAEERRLENEAAKAELKVAKKANKQKKTGAKAEAGDDDLDALLEEFSTQDCMCSFGTCKERINTLVDMIAKCQHCSLRFCLKHVQPEAHGCGDAASRAAQKKQRDLAAASSSGAGLARKSGDNRNSLASKLQDRIKDSEASRGAKKKDKK